MKAAKDVDRRMVLGGAAIAGALDAGFLPGTGSVVHSEITPRHYLDLLGALSGAPLCGVDFVEVSPPLDPSGRSEDIAARLLFEAIRARLLNEVVS
jgi:arginase family enzyme